MKTSRIAVFFDLGFNNIVNIGVLGHGFCLPEHDNYGNNVQ